MARSKSPLQRTEQTFRALLERGDKALGWTIARVPFDPAAAWPEMIRLRVKGKMNGAAFRTSFFADPRGGYYLLVNHTLQRDGHATLGDTAEFRVEPDMEPRPAELPEELAALLEEEPGLREWYDSLSEYTRREIGKWCLGVKGEEARLRRALQMAERLLSTMEAERELPPAIQLAFRKRPKAKAGWALMTEAQRRAELMGVFYYQTPDARERRILKLCDAAEMRVPRGTVEPGA